MTIRLTEKLAKKIRENRLSPLPLNPNPLADWTARLFIFDRTQYILITNTTTLYSIVTYGKGIANVNALIQRMTDTLRDTMDRDGFGETYSNHVAPLTGDIVFAKTLGKAIIGSMNQIAFEAQIHLGLDELPPFSLSLRLNNSFRTYGKGYDRPIDRLRVAVEKPSNLIPIRR